MTESDGKQQEATGDDRASSCYAIGIIQPELSYLIQYYLPGCLYGMCMHIFPVKWHNQHQAVEYVDNIYCI